MKTLYIFPLLLILAGMFSSNHKPAPAALTEDEFMKIYNEYYAFSLLDSIAWNGSVKDCNAGTLSELIYSKAEKRINFYRKVTGLPLIKFNTVNHKFAQEAALMMLAQNKLDHFPAETWHCYSKDGATGASKSCLGFNDFKNFKETAFINGFMKEHGESNYYCGHRRWVLYSKQKYMAYGATRKTEALLTVGDTLNNSAAMPEYVAYPWNGTVPYNFIYSKWSFAIPTSKTVDFSAVKVTCTMNGKVLPLTVYAEKKGFLDPCITWKMTTLFTANEEFFGMNRLVENGYVGKTINVKVANVIVDGELKDYEYAVMIIKV
jgi:hypothetical protein